MVALKRFTAGIMCFYRTSKQERRGGIEIWCRRSSLIAMSEKQERRGGIERPAASKAPRPEVEGSRNAVVALKDFPLEVGAALRDEEAGTPWWY